jgi:hypothetical protein
MYALIVILIIIVPIVAIAIVYHKFGIIAGTILSAIVGAAFAHEVLGKSWTVMGALVFACGAYYLFGSSLSSLLISEL